MNPQNFNPVAEVDFAFYIIFGVSIVMLLGISATALWFVYRYHHTRNPKAEDISGNLLAEVVWIVIPSLIVMALFYYGWAGYKALRTVPDNAMNVKVTARMWSWVFEYDNGKRSSVLYVPKDKPIKLLMTSADVIHSLYIPAYRIKMDTVPRMETYAWFNPDAEGSYDIFCAEYCGLKHANMITTVEVMPPDEFNKWYNGKSKSAGAGKALALLENYGCLSCHSTDGSKNTGPTFSNLYGKKQVVELPDGTKKQVVVDEPYLKRAILNPQTEVPEGFTPAMMPYKDAISDEDLKTILQWFMHGNEVSLDAGRELMMAEGCISCHSTDGSLVAAPSLKDIWGRKVEVLENGKEKTVTSDETYLRESILAPEKLIVKGFDPIMPPYPHLTPEQMQQMLVYMKSLSGAEQ